MSAKVKILVEGFTNADSVAETGEEKTGPTITLVQDEGLVMVVDPGVLESQQVLVGALKKEGLDVKDVNMVCITHSHIDHYRNIGMFEKAKTLEFFGLWDKNTVNDWQEKFTSNIQILRTPGHDYTGITLLVTTKDGAIAICGDVFWKENYPENPKDDAYALDPEKLKESRQMILKMADWIIPGHAGIYKVKKTNNENMAFDEPKKEQELFIACRKCHRLTSKHDKCLCQPSLCYRCCECDLDCDLCRCKHRI